MKSLFKNIRYALTPHLQPSFAFKKINQLKNSELYNNKVGEFGEKIASKYLNIAHSYKILYKNYKNTNGGEVDIVCRDQNTLVFVEVKTRTNDTHGRASRAVDLKKQRLIQRGAFAWLKLLDKEDINYRFDIVEVYIRGVDNMEINLIKQAFELPKNFY